VNVVVLVMVGERNVVQERMGEMREKRRRRRIMRSLLTGVSFFCNFLLFFDVDCYCCCWIDWCGVFFV